MSNPMSSTLIAQVPLLRRWTVIYFEYPNFPRVPKSHNDQCNIFLSSQQLTIPTDPLGLVQLNMGDSSQAVIDCSLVGYLALLIRRRQQGGWQAEHTDSNMGNKERLAEIPPWTDHIISKRPAAQHTICYLWPSKNQEKLEKDLPHLDTQEASSDIFQSEPGRRIYKPQCSHTVEEFRQKVEAKLQNICAFAWGGFWIMQLGVNGNIDSSCGEQCLFAVAPAMDKKNSS